MSNSMGVIFHKDCKDFSPLFVSRNDVSLLYCLQKFLNSEKEEILKREEPSETLLNFILAYPDAKKGYLLNLDDEALSLLIEERYEDGFSSGTAIVDISKKNYGDVYGCDGDYDCSTDNLVTGKLVWKYED